MLPNYLESYMTLGLSLYHSQNLNQVHLSNIHSQIQYACAPATKTWAFCCMKNHCNLGKMQQVSLLSHLSQALGQWPGLDVGWWWAHAWALDWAKGRP